MRETSEQQEPSIVEMTAGSKESGGHDPALNNCRRRSSINVATDSRKAMQQVGTETEPHTDKMKRTLPPSIGSLDIPLTPPEKLIINEFCRVDRVWFGF